MTTATLERVPSLTTAEAWRPARFTPPLAPDFPSDGPRLCELLERFWTMPDGSRLTLDEWQRALFRHVLERFPAGHPLAGELRFRQVMISLGRQNGKSLLAGGLALYGLLQHTGAPSVVGLATSVEQARVIYDRVAYAAKSSPALKARLKATGTRGISRRDGRGQYRVYPALEEGLQSVPVTLGVADELHLMKPAVWDSIVSGQRAQTDALLTGITTAGDETSALLLRLYDQAEAAISHPESDLRFGSFIWESPEAPDLANDAHIIAANPSVACGRVPLERVRSDAAKLPEVDRTRYLFNRFVAQVNAWAPMKEWRANGGSRIPDDFDARRLVFSVARTDAWEHATVVACYDDPKGVIYTEAVASLARPNRGQLAGLLEHLLDEHPGAAAAMEAATLSSVGKELRDAGREIWLVTAAELAQASAAAYAGIMQATILHASDELLTRQLPTVKRKNTLSGGWRVVKGTGDADAVLSTIVGCYVADVRPKPTAILF